MKAASETQIYHKVSSAGHSIFKTPFIKYYQNNKASSLSQQEIGVIKFCPETVYWDNDTTRYNAVQILIICYILCIW